MIDIDGTKDELERVYSHDSIIRQRSGQYLT
jgi:hypothetical protein